MLIEAKAIRELQGDVGYFLESRGKKIVDVLKSTANRRNNEINEDGVPDSDTGEKSKKSALRLHTAVF